MNPLPLTCPSSTIDLPLAEVIARLAAHAVVEGLLTIGSTGRDALNPASDYDIVVILRHAPVPLTVGLTHIDQRLTDIIFVEASEIARLLGEAPDSTPAHWTEAQLLRWLRIGRVVFDHSGLLGRAQVRAKLASESEPTAGECYSAWFSINYNVQQTRRMLASDDPAYQIASDTRLLFSLHDLWRFYFVVRQLTLVGDKDQARYLLDHDPGYLRAFQHCLVQTDRHGKFNAYVGLAAQTLAPLGSLWPDGVTSLLPNPDQPWDHDLPGHAIAFWETLIQPPEA